MLCLSLLLLNVVFYVYLMQFQKPEELQDAKQKRLHEAKPTEILKSFGNHKILHC